MCTSMSIGSRQLHGMQQPGASQQPVVTQHDARALFDRGCSLSFTLDVSQGSGAEVTINLDLLHVSTFVRTVTAIDFSVKRVSASRNGHYLLLVGQQGEDHAAVAVVDLYGGRLVSNSQAAAAGPSTPSGGGGGVTPLRRAAAQATQAASGVRHKECTVHHVDPQLYQSRPGLLVYQASWHPHSDAHLAVLTSDNRWRLYCLEDLSLPEQTFDLKSCLADAGAATSTSAGGSAAAAVNGTPARPGLASPLASPGPARFGLMAGSSLQLQGATAFAFGPPVSWGYFTVLFLTASGAVYALCPVCPFGMKVPASVLRHALGSSGSGSSGGGGVTGGESDAAAAAWLKAAFGSNLLDQGPDSAPRWTAQRHMHDGASPCLQGPLNACAASIAADADAPAVAMHCSFQLALPGAVGDESAGGLPPHCCTSCVVTGLSDGRLFAHACHGLLGPCWADGLPQCVMDVRGDVRAARYQCSTAPLPPAPASSPIGATCGALLLLDAVDLQLPAPAAQLLASPALGGGADSDSDEADEGPGGVLGPDAGLRRLQLLGSSENPQALWACHESGAWLVTVTWLATLSQALAGDAASGGEAGGRGGAMQSDVSLDATLGLGRLQLAVETVPPPVVKELTQLPNAGTGGAWMASAAVLPDLFLGDSLLALKMPGLMQATPAKPGASAAAGTSGAGLQATAISCFRLRAAAAAELGEELEAADATAAPGSGLDARGQSSSEGGEGSLGTGTTASAAPSGPSGVADSPSKAAASPLSAARRELLDANIKAIYADLIRGWTPLKLPKPTGPTGSQDPEGALHLAQCISLMRQHHVEFIHRADADMRQRTQQLDQEAVTHRSALDELQQLLASTRQRQTALMERAHRMLDLHRNLLQRSDILAQLHWSLPRPLSDAEVALASELGSYEARSAALSSSWPALKARLGSAVGDGCEKPHVWSGAAEPASLPPAQAAKVHASVMEQFKLISSAMHEVKQMEADVQAWKLGND